MPRPSKDFYLVSTTAPNRTVARQLVRGIVRRRLAACAHLFPAGESLYWWKGKLERAVEFTLLFKTSKKALSPMIRALKHFHPYETPEIVAVRAADSLPAYRAWVLQETKMGKF